MARFIRSLLASGAVAAVVILASFAILSSAHAISWCPDNSTCGIPDDTCEDLRCGGDRCKCVKSIGGDYCGCAIDSVSGGSSGDDPTDNDGDLPPQDDEP